MLGRLEVTVRAAFGFVMMSLTVSLAVGCDGGKDGGSRTDDILALEGDAVIGADTYAANCESCHGVDAAGGIGPALAGFGEDTEFVEVVLSGEEDMPSFESLPDQDIADILAYCKSL